MALFNHFKKIKVSPGTGGLKLLRDLTEYKEHAKLFNSESIVEKFEVLREIANVHLVAPESLNSLIEETKMNRQDILQFVRLRSDYRGGWGVKFGL